MALFLSTFEKQIDKKGRVHWARNGGEPFSDMAFLVKQLERMNHSTAPETASGGGNAAAMLLRHGEGLGVLALGHHHRGHPRCHYRRC